MQSSLSKSEIFIINRYAASELAGATLLGKMARKTEDPYLRRKLVWHCAEEARHAVMWEDLISDLNISSFNIHDKERKGYLSYINQVEGIIDFLCFVHIYELRVPFHFSIHKQWTKQEKIKNVLTQLIIEEGVHLSWIREYLIKELQKNKRLVLESLKKFSEIEEKTYQDDLKILASIDSEGKIFVELIKEALPKFKRVRDNVSFKI